MSMTHSSPNTHLIGKPNGRAQLATPCLVLDITKLNANIATAAAHAKAKGFALRPHGKSHKCANIGKLQIAAGANGLCVATIGEAERLSNAGITDMLVTSNIAQPGKFARAVAMASGGIKLTLVADDPGTVDAIAAAAAKANVRFDVLVDVDLGRQRNGITTSEQALAVAAQIAAASHLRLAGLQTYASHISHTPSYAARLAANRQASDTVRHIKSTLEAAGHCIETVSGGSTGTLYMDPEMGCYTELQAGSYVFNDAEYMDVDLDGKHSATFAPALTVAVSVIGRNVAGCVTCDGGNKQFSAKGTLPTFLCTPADGAIYRPDSDEHGIIELPTGAAQPALGAGFELIVPHCDPTVNLYDWYHVVDGTTLIAIWPIEARGAF